MLDICNRQCKDKSMKDAIKKYCDEKGSAELAVKLGLKTDESIKKWFQRDSIPKWHELKLKQILKKAGYLED